MWHYEWNKTENTALIGTKMKFYYAEYDNQLSHSSIHNMTLYIATVGYGCYIISNHCNH